MRMFKIRSVISCLLLCIVFQTNAQNSNSWVDSVMKSLSPDEKIAQLIMVRLSSLRTCPSTARVRHLSSCDCLCARPYVLLLVPSAVYTLWSCIGRLQDHWCETLV